MLPGGIYPLVFPNRFAFREGTFFQPPPPSSTTNMTLPSPVPLCSLGEGGRYSMQLPTSSPEFTAQDMFTMIKLVVLPMLWACKNNKSNNSNHCSEVMSKYASMPVTAVGSTDGVNKRIP